MIKPVRHYLCFLHLWDLVIISSDFSGSVGIKFPSCSPCCYCFPVPFSELLTQESLRPASSSLLPDLVWKIAFLLYIMLKYKLDYVFCSHSATIFYNHLDLRSLYHQHKIHRSNAYWELVFHIRADHHGWVNSVDCICINQQISYAWLQLLCFSCCSTLLWNIFGNIAEEIHKID